MSGPAAPVRPAAESVGPGQDFLHRLEKEPPAPRLRTVRDAFRPDLTQGPEGRALGEEPPSVTVVRTGRRHATPLQPLLRKRLLVVTGLYFSMGLSNVLLVLGSEMEQFRAVVVLFLVLLGMTGAFFGIVWWKRSLSVFVLRLIELVFFFGMASIYALHLWEGTWGEGSAWRAHFGERWVALGAQSYMLPWCLLIVSYGIFIPNTWRRATVVLLILMLIPLTIVALADRVDPQRSVGFTVPVVTHLATWLGWATGIAIFGAHRLEVLRQEAVEARCLGQYQLKKLLGTGGMGEVFLAEHLLLRRPCALKLIRPERAGDPGNLLRFEREVRAMARLTHPNTVEVLDYGQADDGTFYYVMEYLPGLSLQDLGQRHGPLPAERVVHLLRQVCGALQEAHVAGLIHRDIKPSNILICERGGCGDVAKLLDFGLVRHVSQAGLTWEGAVAGTPDYMSPEQVADPERVGPRSDLYSLGAVAYFLLTGQPPFVRPTAAETMTAHLREEVLPPSQHVPGLPADVEGLVLACLDKAPFRRPGSAEELGQALGRCACAALWAPERVAAWWGECRDEIGEGGSAAGLSGHVSEAGRRAGEVEGGS